MLNLTLGLFAYFVCFIVLKMLISSAGITNLLADHPSARSLHTGVKPRIGGTGIAISIFVCFCIGTVLATSLKLPVDQTLTLTVCAYLALFVISLVDDAHSLSALTRLIFQIAVIALWLWATNQNLWLGKAIGNESLYFVSFIMIGIGITWVSNLYNFMDGADGIAGSMSVVGFSSYAIAAQIAGDFQMAAFAWTISLSCLAFLWFNWPPSKIFLGDSGSIPLGFIAATIGLVGINRGIWTPEFPLAVFAMFWVDASQTLARRLFRRERFWEPHKDHWYQKIVESGKSHLTLVKIHLICNISLASVALSSFIGNNVGSVHNRGLAIFLVATIVFAFGYWAEMICSKPFTQK
jgi:UDP-GlcNAc:undecaprenyl-phosphate/decaprenyl-phosphate GlcNAc-1-phosphate transferase